MRISILVLLAALTATSNAQLDRFSYKIVPVGDPSGIPYFFKISTGSPLPLWPTSSNLGNENPDEYVPYNQPQFYEHPTVYGGAKSRVSPNDLEGQPFEEVFEYPNVYSSKYGVFKSRVARSIPDAEPFENEANLEEAILASGYFQGIDSVTPPRTIGIPSFSPRPYVLLQNPPPISPKTDSGAPDGSYETPSRKPYPLPNLVTPKLYQIPTDYPLSKSPFGDPNTVQNIPFKSIPSTEMPFLYQFPPVGYQPFMGSFPSAVAPYKPDLNAIFGFKSQFLPPTAGAGSDDDSGTFKSASKKTKAAKTKSKGSKKSASLAGA